MESEGDVDLSSSESSPEKGADVCAVSEPQHLEDLVLVNEECIEKLSEGLISHYLPDLQRSRDTLQELTQNQVVLLDTLEQEITKFRECNSMIDLNALLLREVFL
ncbi:hypothetical protein PDJAM_G00218170 [Pangasius djambal]|uniref:Uncharacterized protein n=1 Tax=Pangasius djambal TaxID=1691987 RepID=A0ACC5YDH5_9TELE|nr:hypothetical protein [Pangasius djambal]